MSNREIQIPRSVIALLCTLLQLCFGTVYAWSFFQTLLVRQLGWTFTETAWAFSIAIFSLGTSAAWAGATLPRFGPRKLAVAGSIMFSGGYMIASLALHLDSIPLFYLGYGVIGGAGIGLGYVTPVATAAKWFPRSQGSGDGHCRDGIWRGRISLEQSVGTFSRAANRVGSHLCLLVARHCICLYPLALQLCVERSQDRRCTRRCRR